jgi:hypothetical protein
VFVYKVIKLLRTEVAGVTERDISFVVRKQLSISSEGREIAFKTLSRIQTHKRKKGSTEIFSR